MPKNRVRHRSDSDVSAERITIPLTDVKDHSEIQISTSEYRVLYKRCHARLLKAIGQEVIVVESSEVSVDGPTSYIIRIDDFANSAVDHFAARCGCVLNRNAVRRQLPSLRWLLDFSRVSNIGNVIVRQISDHIYATIFAELFDQGLLLYDEDEYTLYVDIELIEQIKPVRAKLQPAS